MSTPSWILGIFGAVMLLIAEVSAGQLVMARPWTRRDIAGAGIAVSQLLTGIAMAGILVPGLTTLPDAAWDVAFAAITGWFAWCLWQENRGRGAAAMARGRYAPHLVQSATMLYLFAALTGPITAGSGTSTGSMPGMPGMPAMTGGTPALRAPTLALILALLLIAFTVHDLDRQAGVDGVDGVDGYFQAVGRPPVPAGPALAAAAERLLLSPAVAKGCQVATGVTMAFILIIMI